MHQKFPMKYIIFFFSTLFTHDQSPSGNLHKPKIRNNVFETKHWLRDTSICFRIFFFFFFLFLLSHIHCLFNFLFRSFFVSHIYLKVNDDDRYRLKTSSSFSSFLRCVFESRLLRVLTFSVKHFVIIIFLFIINFMLFIDARTLYIYSFLAASYNFISRRH